MERAGKRGQGVLSSFTHPLVGYPRLSQISTRTDFSSQARKFLKCRLALSFLPGRGEVPGMGAKAVVSCGRNIHPACSRREGCAAESCPVSLFYHTLLPGKRGFEPVVVIQERAFSQDMSEILSGAGRGTTCLLSYATGLPGKAKTRACVIMR